MEIADHCADLLRNLYALQETTVKTRHGTVDWSKLAKEYKRLYILRLLIQLTSSTSCDMVGWMNHKLK